MSLREFDLPRIGPDDGLLRVEAAGICGTDTGQWTGRVSTRHVPRILGHEIIGRVEEIGERLSAATGVSKGDRVCVETRVPCGMCRSCLTIGYRFCTAETPVRYGATLPITLPPALWGAYGEYMYLAPRTVMHRVSTEVPVEAAALINAVIANGIQWTRRIADVFIGDTVVVQGAGPQGMAQVVAAAASGANPIVVTGLTSDEARFALARQFGATHAINVEQEDVIRRVAEITAGEMADVVIDVTGSPQALIKSIELSRPGGTVISAGEMGDAIASIAPDRITRREIRFQGVVGKGYEATRSAVKLVESGKYPLEKMVTHKFALRDVREAMDVASGKEPGALKVLLIP